MGDIVRLVRKGRFIGWYIRYRDTNGQRRMRASHQPTRELARRYLLTVEGRVARGIIGIPEPEPEAPTVAALCERFLSEYSRPKIKDLTRYRRVARIALRRALPMLGDLRVDALRPAHLERLRLTLCQTHAPASVRHSLAFLGSVFGWATRVGVVPSNPLRGLDKPAAPPSLEYLKRAQVRALLVAADTHAESGTPAARCLRACVHLALHTGLRRGELLGLRFQDVDVEDKRLTIARSFAGTPKSGKPRHLRLPEAAVPVLSAWLAEVPRDCGVVFPVFCGARRRRGNGSDLLGLPALLTAAGCPPMRRPWHSLRHTFASHFIMSGGNLLALQKILGHSDIKQTMVYAHLGEEFLGSEIDRLRF